MIQKLGWPVTMWQQQENMGLTVGVAAVAFLLTVFMFALAWPTTLVVAVVAFLVGLAAP